MVIRQFTCKYWNKIKIKFNLVTCNLLKTNEDRPDMKNNYFENSWKIEKTYYFLKFHITKDAWCCGGKKCLRRWRGFFTKRIIKIKLRLFAWELLNFRTLCFDYPFFIIELALLEKLNITIQHSFKCFALLRIKALDCKRIL